VVMVRLLSSVAEMMRCRRAAGNRLRKFPLGHDASDIQSVLFLRNLLHRNKRRDGSLTA
jgi:hypothetical protein